MRTRRPSSLTPLRGELTVPGDRCISLAALMVAARASGTSWIHALNPGSDVGCATAALQALGVACSVDDRGDAEVRSEGWRALREPTSVVDAGRSTATIHHLLGLCSAIEGLSVVTADEALPAQLLGIVGPLRRMGATVDGRDHGNRPPLAIRGSRLEAIAPDAPVTTGSITAALLLAGSSAAGWTTLTEEVRSADHVERLLGHAGIPPRRRGTSVAVHGPAEPSPLSLTVPGDVSSATLLAVAATLTPGSALVVKDVAVNPTRTGALSALQAMGARITIEATSARAPEPSGDLVVESSALQAIEVNEELFPGASSELPALALAASQAEGTSSIAAAGRVPPGERARVVSVAEGLRTLGVPAEASARGLTVTGPCRLGGGEVDAQLDDAVAMAFAVAGLISGSQVRVRGWSSVARSFPDFLGALATARRRK